MCLKAPLYQLRSNRDINNCIISVEMTPWYQQLHDISSRYGGWIAKIKTGKIHYDTQSCGCVFTHDFYFQSHCEEREKSSATLVPNFSRSISAPVETIHVPGSRIQVSCRFCIVLQKNKCGLLSCPAMDILIFMHACLPSFFSCMHSCLLSRIFIPA